MSEDTKRIVTGVAVAAGVLFLFLSCGSDRNHYCVQWEGPNCVDYEMD
jgi:hypothetical protein